MPRAPKPLSWMISCVVLGLSSWGALTLSGCGPAQEEPVDVTQWRDCRVPIFYRSEATLSEPVLVLGSFNGWRASAAWALEDLGGGLHRGLFKLPPGRHAYTLLVEGRRVNDALNPLTLYPRSADEELSVVYASDCDQPELEVIQRQGKPDGVLATLRFKRAWGGSPLARVEVKDAQGQPLRGATWSASTGQIQLSLSGLPPGKHHVQLVAWDEQGVASAPLRLTFWAEAQELQWQDAVIYQIVLDRFASGSGPLDGSRGISFFHGGDLDGVTQALEAGYFQELGVNVLWLSPVYDNPEGVFIGRDGHEAQAYHGYWPKGPRQVEPRLGGEQAFDRLIAAAHQRGVRVIVDTVLNHVHQEHPYAKPQDPRRWFNQPQGDCICGFTCPWHLHMEDCWFDPFMPDLQLRNPEVMDLMIEDTLWWMERFDLDGLRLDAVPMMPRMVMRHLRHHVRERFERGGPPVYLLGETFTHKREQGIIRYFLGPHTLSGQFDFPVMWSLRDALAGRTPMTALAQEAQLSDEAWEGSGSVMAPILGNHDVPRFISDVNGDPIYSPRQVQPTAPTQARPYELLKAAWVFIMSQPGAPIIYYGDEIGMPGANDPDNRRPMRFEPDLDERARDVRAHVARLSRARACATALRRGQRQTVSSSLETFAQLRDAQDGFPALAALNRGDSPAELALELPASLTLDARARFGALDGEPVSLQGRTLKVTVPARSGTLILSQPECIEGAGSRSGP